MSNIQDVLDDDQESSLTIENETESASNETAIEKIIWPEPKMVVNSRAMQDVIKKLRKASRIKYFPVLLVGETGVGKQEAARFLHMSSDYIHNQDRKPTPFIDVNCGGFTKTVLESVLFGHTRGSFTGAFSDKMGMIEMSREGLLFLDEIGNAKNSLQKRLLKYLDNGKVRKMGATEETKVQTRIVAATHDNLREAVTKNKLREDLFYRLKVFTVFIPPLRARKEDIVPLVKDCIRRFNHDNCTKITTDISVDVQAKLETHDWPGNVRELFNTIKGAIVNCGGVGSIRVIDLVFEDRTSPSASIEITKEIGGEEKKEIKIGDPWSIFEIEKDHIKKVWENNNYNTKRTAKVLNINRRTLVDKITRYRLERFD